MLPDELADLAALRPDLADARATRLPGGRNSRIYRLDQGGRSLALKRYHRHPGDPRDRLGVEFAALSHLTAHGFDCVPRPIWMDAGANLGLYSFIEGRPCPAAMIPAALRQAAGFVARLHALSGHPDSRGFGPASEACFSLADIAANLERRLDRLLRAPGGKRHEAMRRFLENGPLPARSELLERGRGILARAGLDPDDPLPQAERCLSPSDFGLHNALVAGDGTVFFLDFEYFGFDDPVKLAADFLLHPAMTVPPADRLAFAREMLDRFSPRPAVLARFRACLPLYGLAWCLILLGEFLAPELSRRDFSGAAADSRDALLSRQLAASRAMLDRALRETGPDFPAPSPDIPGEAR